MNDWEDHDKRIARRFWRDRILPGVYVVAVLLIVSILLRCCGIEIAQG